MAASVILNLILATSGTPQTPAGSAPPRAHLAGRVDGNLRDRDPARRWLEAAALCAVDNMEALAPAGIVAAGDKYIPFSRFCDPSFWRWSVGWSYQPGLARACSAFWGFCLDFFIVAGSIAWIRAEPLPPSVTAGRRS